MQDISIFISHHPLLSAAVFVVFIILVCVELMRARRNVFNINPVRLTQLINRENAVVIDIRPQEVWRKGHIIDAQSMSANDILDNAKKLEKFRARPIIVVANAGHESQKIAAILLKRGYNAYSLSGGMRAWSEAQMPVVGG
jgi:rhodanese-related sulfurtransferase